MPLTREDIERIARLGYSVEEFAVMGSDGVYYLRNTGGHCFFLDEDTGRCRIYPWRPEGCRLYPLVYDMDEGKVTVDSVCPMAATIGEDLTAKYAQALLGIIKRIYGKVPRSA